QARRLAKRHAREILRHGQKTALTEQRGKLVQGIEKSDEIDDSESALEQQPREPVPGSVKQIGHHRPSIVYMSSDGAHPLCRLAVDSLAEPSRLRAARGVR